jgi:hypothetical protein
MPAMNMAGLCRMLRFDFTTRKAPYALLSFEFHPFIGQNLPIFGYRYPFGKIGAILRRGFGEV